MSFADVTPKAILQILILAVGIYLLLAFLRSARGSGLVRGLGLTLIIGVYGLWWISGYFELGELRHVIQAFLSLVFVILAIVFQPELRRGISSLSDNPLLSRLLRTQRKESIVEVASAVVSMAKKKQGALIAVERRTPLDSYASQAVQLDCEVNRYLIDALFHPGSALHDGGVIVRGDRVVAAGAVFPLSETDDVAKSTGTRHRAALGITEETDAVAVAVSEETGLISITKHGKMERRIKRDQVEEVLRDALGTDGLVRRSLEEGEEPEQPAAPDLVPNLLRTLVAHGGQKLGALLIAVFVFYGAHQDLMGRRSQPLRVVQTADANAPSEPGKLTVVLPSRLYRLKEEPSVDVTFVGTHEDLAISKQEVSGRIVLTEEELGDGGEEIAIEADRVTWSLAMGDRIDAYWSGADLQLAVEELAALEVTLRPELVALDVSQLGRNYTVDRSRMEFRPSVVTLRGPSAAIDDLERRLAEASDGPGVDPIFELDKPVTSAMVRAGSGSSWVGCELIRPLEDPDQEAKEALEMEGELEVRVQVALSTAELGELTLPISLVALSGVADTRNFLAPSAQATVRVSGRGVPDREPGSDEWTLDGLEILSLVREHVRAFIDVDSMDPGSNQGRVELHEPADWRALLKELGPEFDYVTKDPRITLILELIGDREVFVDARSSSEGGNDEEDQ